MISRRVALGCLALPFAVCASERDELLEVLGSMASALSGDSYSMTDASSRMQAVADFMSHVDKSFPERERLRGMIEALISSYEIGSSVELVRFDPAGSDVDWYMELRSRNTAGGSERRRKVIKVHMKGKKVAGLDPLDFFSAQVAR